MTFFQNSNKFMSFEKYQIKRKCCVLEALNDKVKGHLANLSLFICLYFYVFIPLYVIQIY